VILLGLDGFPKFGWKDPYYPRGFLTKSSQCQQNKRDKWNSELRRVRKILKIKERDFEKRQKSEVMR